MQNRGKKYPRKTFSLPNNILLAYIGKLVSWYKICIYDHIKVLWGGKSDHRCQFPFVLGINLFSVLPRSIIDGAYTLAAEELIIYNFVHYTYSIYCCYNVFSCRICVYPMFQGNDRPLFIGFLVPFQT
jgi:hypothetical protein